VRISASEAASSRHHDRLALGWTRAIPQPAGADSWPKIRNRSREASPGSRPNVVGKSRAKAANQLSRRNAPFPETVTLRPARAARAAKDRPPRERARIEPLRLRAPADVSTPGSMSRSDAPQR
jgi:hypothetical protein